MSLMWQSSAKRVCMPANVRWMFSDITFLRILCTMKLSLQAFWTSTKKIAKSAVQTSK